MRVFSIASVLVLSSACVIAACGGTTADKDGEPKTTDPTPVEDAGTISVKPPVTRDAGVDAALPPDPIDPKYPSSHTPIAPVDYNGGPVLKTPKIVTITFPGDGLRARLEAFGDVITQTPWWDAVIDGYCDSEGCIGRGVAGEHVVMPTKAASSYTDFQGEGPSSVRDMLQAGINDGTIPAPTPDTLYAIYFPSGTRVSLTSGPQVAESCQDFGGYHLSAGLTPKEGGAALDVAYAIMPRCGGEQVTTITASHEFIEAATDPSIREEKIAWYMNSARAAVGGGEVGDVCVDFSGRDTDRYVESGFTVQRSWSNKQAKLSHDPCVPAPAGEVYFNVAAAKDEIILDVGKTVTVDLKGFSDAPKDDWDVHVTSFNTVQGGGTNVTTSLNKSAMHNGSKATLTITLNSSPREGYEVLFIVSDDGSRINTWPILVASH
jgi:hypothetical protein